MGSKRDIGLDWQACLKALVQDLQHRVASVSLNIMDIDQGIATLAGIGYAYDDEKYPSLPQCRPEAPTVTIPTTLAELLLWKLGKWKAFKGFAEFYRDGVSAPRGSRSVVFDAFALHLQNRDTPIFDQHSLRAVWALYGKERPMRRDCQRFLFGKSRAGVEGWKHTGSGPAGVSCYRWFLRRVNTLTTQAQAPPGKLDRLLMPLGQALKDATRDYDSFSTLCGRPSDVSHLG